MILQNSLPASIDDVLLAFNLINNNLNPVNKLINKNELYSILNDYSFNGSTYALPYLMFVDAKLPGGVVDFEYNNKIAFSVLVDHCYTINKHKVAKLMFGTDDVRHPGVDKFLSTPKHIISGEIVFFDETCIDIPYHNTNIVCDTVFQSRNPPHTAHEYIIKKYAPKLTYSTPYSTTNPNDYPFLTKIKTYEEIKQRYNIDIYVTTLPRVFAGPREALQNCLLFQNKGATKLVMGRGKNCVKDFYTETASFEMCKNFFDDNRISIEPIWQETIFANNTELSGSVIKLEYINKGILPPANIMSPYISEILLSM